MEGGDYMQNEPREFHFFSTGYKQLKRTIFGMPVVAIIVMALGKFIDSFFLKMCVIVVFLPICIIMTIVDYHRLIKKRFEKPNIKLLLLLLTILVMTLSLCIIWTFLF